MTDKTTHDSLLGATSRWTAGVRARESRRADRLFNDPWAASLAGPEGEEWVEHRSGDNGVSITIRTRFLDDFLQRATHEHQVRQVVLVDTRAFRLNWPERTRIKDASYGRWPYPVLPREMPDVPRSWFVTAWKKQRVV